MSHMDLTISKLEPRNKHYQLRLTQTELETLQNLSQTHGVSVAELIRQMINQVVHQTNKNG